VAQLGARFHGMEEVDGSNPSRSTKVLSNRIREFPAWDTDVMRLVFGLLIFSAILSAQAGWQTMKDKTGACQLSVPGNWSMLSTSGHAGSPEHMDTTVISGNRPFRKFQFSAGELQVLNVDKVFENSPQRVFYSTKPQGTPVTMSYHVEAPGRSNDCIAQISSTPSFSLDIVKKIAESLSAAH
jgi:hypothetical protein